MAERFRKHAEAYFAFITTPGMDPTNNVAEQAIRFVVIDRHVTQGTRSANGRRANERLWTVIATCALQGRSAFAFILQAVEAYFHDEPPPSLLPLLPDPPRRAPICSRPATDSTPQPRLYGCLLHAISTDPDVRLTTWLATTACNPVNGYQVSWRL